MIRFWLQRQRNVAISNRSKSFRGQRLFAVEILNEREESQQESGQILEGESLFLILSILR